MTHHERHPVGDLRTFHTNPKHGDVEAIAESLRINGQYRPIVVNRGTYTNRPMEVLAGNHTLMAHRLLCERHGGDTWGEIDCWVIDVDDDQASRIVLADNRTADLGTYDDTVLLDLLQTVDDLEGTGYAFDDLEGLIADQPLNTVEEDGEETDGEPEPPAMTLADRFGVPPMSILDTRQGAWGKRRQAWDSRGINSDHGRESELVYASVHALYHNWYDVRNKALAENPTLTDREIEEQYQHQLKRFAGRTGTSTFDPVLAEILYSWFAPPNAHILDPWAGGSVRGIVAAQLGHHYTGHELRAEQVQENQQQYATYTTTHQPPGTAEWVTGDSRETLQQHPPGTYTMAIGCPPYYDLEEYSDDPNDLSNLTTEQFNTAMLDTLRQVDRALAPHSFACFIVGNVRDKHGDLRDMRALMVHCADTIGWKLANDAVLINKVGTVAVRTARPFLLGRSLGRVHQDVLIFVKGDRKTAAKNCGETVNLLDIPDTEQGATDD